ncbi:MAG: cobalt ECF transporter T component CbiQ [Candidatus Omnitrophica bacterium]|nr:cobalt ECF transporter T component CbiQ [Candidatus Omnitrophota bacterium]
MKFKSHNYIQRSLLGMVSFFKEAIFAEEFAFKPGLLQKIEPRIKAALILSLILASIFIKTTPLLLVLYLFCLLLAALSRISLIFFLKRTWVFMPIFALIIALPLFFTGRIQEGVLFVVRVLTSLSFAVLLGLTTPHTLLLKTMRSFGIPQMFVMTLGMCYRYIFLFAEIIENTYLAIKSRVGGAIHYKHGQHIATWKIASLWQKSLQLNKDIYDAMLSRGYTGEPKVLDE